MKKQQLLQIAIRNILQRRSNAQDKCEQTLSKLRSHADWEQCEKNLKQAQVDFVMNDNKPADRKKINGYKALQEQLLAKYGVTEQMLTPSYHCPKCNDTGFVGNRYCQCLQEEIRRLLVKDSNLANPNCTFANSTDKNKRNCAVYKKAQKICVENILQNVLLLGNVGTGKTYLLYACANECLACGKSVAFTTAYALNETFLQCHLASYETKQLVMENLLEVDALFIDDLGTENVYRNVTAEYLFVLINERAVSGKQTFISTNLTLADIRDRYDERIFSRLVDQKITLVAQLEGADKRM